MTEDPIHYTPQFFHRNEVVHVSSMALFLKLIYDNDIIFNNLVLA